MTKINNIIAYPYESPIQWDDFVIGTVGETGQTRNFLFLDIAQFVMNIMTGGIKGWVTIEITEDTDTFIVPQLVGAISVDWIMSNNMLNSTAGQGITFDSVNGIITGITAFAGEKYVIAYTKSVE